MAWRNGKKVDALWANYQSKNAWAWIDGGWRKCRDNNSNAVTNLTILLAHAKGENENVDVELISSEISELYVW